MNIFVKNMISVRCKMAVEKVLNELSIPYHQVSIGMAQLAIELTPEQQEALNTALQAYELEILVNRKEILTERIKNLIVDFVRSETSNHAGRFTAFLSESLKYDYTYLSNIFTEQEGSTIERFFIMARIQRVKEFMLYDELSVKEIAYRLNYSSVGHLCRQFKKMTGQTASEFKKAALSGNFSLVP